VNFHGAAAFILTVIPFEQMLIHLRPSAESSQFAGPRCPLQGAGEHRCEFHSFQPLAEAAGVQLASLG
jgi:hypothetical protein